MIGEKCYKQEIRSNMKSCGNYIGVKQMFGKKIGLELELYIIRYHHSSTSMKSYKRCQT